MSLQAVITASLHIFALAIWIHTELLAVNNDPLKVVIQIIQMRINHGPKYCFTISWLIFKNGKRENLPL